MERNGKKVIFEIETYYKQNKIIRFIVASSFLGTDSIVIIYSDQKDVWDGKKRAQATNYLGKILNSILLKPVKITSFFAETPSDLKKKLLIDDFV